MDTRCKQLISLNEPRKFTRTQRPLVHGHRIRHAMSHPTGTFALNSKQSVAPAMFQPKAINNSSAITAATHIALTRANVSALRHMIYESHASVWESRLSFTAHLKRIDTPATAHGALYRLMAAEPDKERVTCVDLVDIDLLFDRATR